MKRVNVDLSLDGSGLEFIKLFMLNLTEHKFILSINVKMPTIVGILTLISRIDTTFESFKVKKSLFFNHFHFYQQLKFHAVEHEKTFHNLGPRWNHNLGPRWKLMEIQKL